MVAISVSTTFALLLCLVLLLFQSENQRPFLDTDGGGRSSSSIVLRVVSIVIAGCPFVCMDAIIVAAM